MRHSGPCRCAEGQGLHFPSVGEPMRVKQSMPRARKGDEHIMATERLIIIGGDAAGMSAASQARRRRPELEIVAFERSPHTSYSA
jgi:hypothetical protein